MPIAQPAAACLGERGGDEGTAPEKMAGGGERLNGEVIHCCATSSRQRGLPPPWNPPFQGRAALKIPGPMVATLGTGLQGRGRPSYPRHSPRRLHAAGGVLSLL